MDGMDWIHIYHVPVKCSKCSGVMIYQGVGEYKCEMCGSLEYDDYGKVRNYIETHKGATAPEVEAATGVSQRTIRHMLKDSRIQVAADSNTFMHCEICGKNIRSGRYCTECEVKVHRRLEEQQREAHRKSMHGYGSLSGEEGQRRFLRGADHEKK